MPETTVNLKPSATIASKLRKAYGTTGQTIASAIKVDSEEDTGVSLDPGSHSPLPDENTPITTDPNEDDTKAP